MRLKIIGLMMIVVSVAHAEPVTIARVVDGDTVALTDGRHVRLLGVDTPEKWPSAKLNKDSLRTGQSIPEIVALGKQATAHTEQLLANRKVRLEYDREPTDKYHRTLAYIYTRTNVLVNAQIIADGYGCALTRYPIKLKAQMVNAQHSAQQRHAGLWSQHLQCDVH